MSRLVAKGIEKAFGDRRVLLGCDLDVHAGQRVGLVGVNGSGKSTLLRILSGVEHSDHGVVDVVGRLEVLTQTPELTGNTVGEVVDRALGWHADLLASWEQALADDRLDDAATLQDRLDTAGWSIEHKADAMLGKVGAPPREALVEHLSGGERRRVDLAKALLGAPDVLLLDEPTNHLDAETVEWLEGYLAGFRGALLLVTHDRYLLEAVADRIVEIEKGELVSYDGSYADYLIARAARQARLSQSRSRLLSAIAREAAWASRSPSARSTKQKARLQRLDAMREKVPSLDERTLELDLTVGVPRGSTLLEVHGLHKELGGRQLISDLELVLRPGDRIGVVGPNGAGKSTLLRILCGEQTADTGQLVTGPRCRIGVLDQHRTGLDPDETVFESAGGGNDQVRVGDRWVHVVTFLSRFAFTREHLDQHTSSLSGGERARLLLARLMLQGASVLLLDEPTNDLDLMTLRILEEALLAFDGATVVVTHDRAFLDRVCTGILAFGSDRGGQIDAFASRTQWLADLRARRAAPTKATKVTKAAKAEQSTNVTPARTLPTLSYAEKRELDALPDRIDALEQERSDLDARLSDPETYKEGASGLASLTARASALPAEIDALYARWEALSERA